MKNLSFVVPFALLSVFSPMSLVVSHASAKYVPGDFTSEEASASLFNGNDIRVNATAKASHHSTPPSNDDALAKSKVEVEMRPTDIQQTIPEGSASGFTKVSQDWTWVTTNGATYQPTVMTAKCEGTYACNLSTAFFNPTNFSVDAAFDFNTDDTQPSEIVTLDTVNGPNPYNSGDKDFSITAVDPANGANYFLGQVITLYNTSEAYSHVKAKSATTIALSTAQSGSNQIRPQRFVTQFLSYDDDNPPATFPGGGIKGGG